jgi:hypothetical protein
MEGRKGRKEGKERRKGKEGAKEKVRGEREKELESKRKKNLSKFHTIISVFLKKTNKQDISSRKCR